MLASYRYNVKKGNAPDAYAGGTLFDNKAVSKFLGMKCWDQPVMVKLTHEGTIYGDEIELDPDDPTLQIPFAARGFDVKNKQAGIIGRYEIRCYW